MMAAQGSKTVRRWALLGGSIAAALAIVSAALVVVERLDGPRAAPEVWLGALPDRIGPRAGDVTLNINGMLEPGEVADWRWNGGDWQSVSQAGPRAEQPAFVIEVPSGLIVLGDRNTVEIRVTDSGGEQTTHRHEFEVGSDGQAGELLPEPHDGLWDWQGDLSAVRPLPGHEGYDRIFIVHPEIAGGRHVQASVEFGGSTQSWTHRLRYGAQYGFGIVPLWGGHPDPTATRPRRGWLYAMAWYYSRDGGFGSEAALRRGAEPMTIVKSYADWEPDEQIQIDAFAATVQSDTGAFLGWCLVSVLTSADRSVHADPLFVEPDLLSERDYAAGLIAHRARASFRDISWRPLAPLIADGPAAEACASYQPLG